jgi:hypothetical protein
MAVSNSRSVTRYGGRVRVPAIAIVVLTFASACSGGNVDSGDPTPSEATIAERFSAGWVEDGPKAADAFLCQGVPGTAGLGGTGFTDARVTGPAMRGPDQGQTFIVSVSPAPDFHVPIRGLVRGASSTGAIEVTVRGGEPPCVETYGVAYDDVSPTPA